MYVTIRISRSPAHVAIRFSDEDVFQKISFRPWFGTPAFWTRGTFEGNVFTRPVKLAHPLMFYIPSEIPADAAKSKYAEPPPPAVSKPPPASDKKTESSRDKKPADDQNTKNENKDDDWSQDWNDWHDDWNAGNSWNDDRHRHRQSDEKSDTPSEASEEPENPPKVTVRMPETPPPVHAEIFGESSNVVKSTVSQPDVTTKNADPNSSNIITEPSGHEEPPISHAPTSTSATMVSLATYQENFAALQRMADMGPPFSLEDRYARQTLANRLALSPLVYNMMVFGEVPTAQK